MNDIILILIQFFVGLGLDVYPATIVACFFFSYMFIGLLFLPYIIYKEFSKYYVLWFDNQTFSIHKGMYTNFTKKMFEKKYKQQS